ncbi:pVIII [Murine adenovirus 3]|uniref:Pre-hexon-linking protein VIII n=1 Tax=Murine adenovirus 3 TaxID=573199 RepID=C3SAV3_9ADEN|nr:pVIII [Murine adenovirus 3]ACJ14523.1 pVIII [Murine adenovirus 3]
MSAPSPYMWTFQPQRGTAAGASQDYSTRLNWLSAGPSLRGKVIEVNQARNSILLNQQEAVPTPRRDINPPSWPASLIFHPRPKPIAVLPAHPDSFDPNVTLEGAQLAGGAWVRYKSGNEVRYTAPIQLAEEPTSRTPTAYALAQELQLAGGATATPPLMGELAGAPRVPRSGGIGSWQFTQEFPPTVYLNPYSGAPDTFPHQFLSNYDSVSQSVNGYD